MRKLNTKRTVLLDVVPEHRTKRCSPGFRPGDRFCEQSSLMKEKDWIEQLIARAKI